MTYNRVVTGFGHRLAGSGPRKLTWGRGYFKKIIQLDNNKNCILEAQEAFNANAKNFVMWRVKMIEYTKSDQ